MCTAISVSGAMHYFGRNLDYEEDFGEKITITQRNYPFRFGEKVIDSHYAIIGMALPVNGYPLYFDATNEAGLSMAGLLFSGCAVYNKPINKKENIPSFQFIPWVLTQCTTTDEAEKFLENVNITDEAFLPDLPPSPLHWMIADSKNTLVAEQTKDGFKIIKNPTGVLTNSPEFSFHMQYLNNFLGLSVSEPENKFSQELDLRPYSRGMGALGLPGDLSSSSRFVRACFNKLNSVWSGKEEEDVSQFFHILNLVSQTKGCNKVGEKWEITQYSSCCDTKRGIYYYTTYNSSRILAVDMFCENLDGNGIVTYDLDTTFDILYHNQ